MLHIAGSGALNNPFNPPIIDRETAICPVPGTAQTTSGEFVRPKDHIGPVLLYQRLETLVKGVVGRSFQSGLNSPRLPFLVSHNSMVYFLGLSSIQLVCSEKCRVQTNFA